MYLPVLQTVQYYISNMYFSQTCISKQSDIKLKLTKPLIDLLFHHVKLENIHSFEKVKYDEM